MLSQALMIASRYLIVIGRGRIRTYVELLQQIYSLSLLTARPLSLSLMVELFKPLFPFAGKSFCLPYGRGFESSSHGKNILRCVLTYGIMCHCMGSANHMLLLRHKILVPLHKIFFPSLNLPITISSC